ncbi:helix-turn-helix transcriptional regulator [Nocardia pneumoniae]|uniref:helix-turn-helix transcriptional regulator n=1 Tax=Nocardia pneumoniae TaxID=228601 RepID=UPI0002F692E4|nr:AraC family transcriptional regulator [Nocardia pneumoniae]
MTAAIPRWLGGVVFTPGLMAFTGDIGDTAAHSHAAVQVLLVTRGELTLTDGSGTVSRADLAIIPPGVRHEVRATPETAGFLAYLDPASAVGRAAVARLADRPADQVRSWIAAAVPASPGHPPRPPALPLPRRATHPVVLAAMELADASPVGPPSLGEVARRVAMSPSRLSHLFAAEVGLPYAAWRRWTRLHRAIDQVRAGRSLTEAAHAAGFADSAHLTRTCRDLFGITPTDALLATGWRGTPPRATT